MIRFFYQLIGSAQHAYFSRDIHCSFSISLSLICLVVLIFGCSKEPEPEIDCDTDIPIENLGPVDCDEKRCFVVEPSSEYCSLDPTLLPLSGYFKTKSRATVAAGAYPLNTEHDRDVLISVSTAAGKSSLTPLHPFEYKVDSGGSDFNDVGYFKISNPYVSNNLHLKNLVLVTEIVPCSWSHPHARLGDPGDIWWWSKARRNLVITIEQKSPLFPELSGLTDIRFAPCELRGQPDDLFSFEFKSGEILNLTVRSIVSTTMTGNYIGRLLKAQGKFMGHSVDVQELENLAFFGSWYHAESPMPGLVVRWAQKEDTCGVIFDPFNGGWKAFILTCDDKRGEEVPLANVEHPNKYSVPSPQES